MFCPTLFGLELPFLLLELDPLLESITPLWRISKNLAPVLRQVFILCRGLALGAKYNIYFWLRFGLANAINDYLRLTIRIVCNSKFLLIAFVISYLSQIYFLIPEIFKISFWVQNHLLNLRSLVVKSQRLFCSKKSGVKMKWLRSTDYKKVSVLRFPLYLQDQYLYL